MIGTKIKQLREDRKFSQDYMAKQIGVTQTVYSRIENNLSKVDIERLQAISNVLEVPIEELITHDSTVFNIYNNKVGYAVYQSNKELYESTFAFFKEQIITLLEENRKMMTIILDKFPDKK